MGSTSSIAPMMLLLLVAVLVKPSSCLGFTCSSTVSSCKAVVGYTPQNKTTLSSIRTLFSIPDLRTLLSANNLPDDTPPTRSVSSAETIRIPFACSCKNKTGTSVSTPTYIVKSGDTLDGIASNVFSHLVTYTDIAKASNISYPNVIEPGQNVTIPLPCSCDSVDGAQVLHYGHVVAPGSNVSGIALQFGTTEKVLLDLNGMANASLLQAYQVLNVPLKVCNSSVKKDSLDYPLLVANDMHVYTANDCVKCSCNTTYRQILNCIPSGLNSANKTKCPSLQCGDGSTLGISVGSACNMSTCSYTGYYANSTIPVELITNSTCPATSPSGGSTRSSGWVLTCLCTVAAVLLMFL